MAAPRMSTSRPSEMRFRNEMKPQKVQNQKPSCAGKGTQRPQVSNARLEREPGAPKSPTIQSNLAESVLALAFRLESDKVMENPETLEESQGIVPQRIPSALAWVNWVYSDFVGGMFVFCPFAEHFRYMLSSSTSKHVFRASLCANAWSAAVLGCN